MSNPKYLSDLPMTPYGRFLNPQGYKAPWQHNMKRIQVVGRFAWNNAQEKRKTFVL